jgi:hypothetical protein
MKYDILDRQVDNETISADLKAAESQEERELIMLAVIRNNLNTIRDHLETIKGWMTFIGILIVIGIVVSLF